MPEIKQENIVLQVAKSQSDWEDACVDLPYATAYHRYDFLSAVAPTLNGTFVPLLAVSNEKTVGIAPLIVKQRGPFCMINSVPFPYLGPLAPTSLVPAVLSALRIEAKRRRACYHCQWLFYFLPGPVPGGFSARRDNTFIIPLEDRSDQELLDGMHATRRREIRRAQQAGLEVRPAVTEDFGLMDTWNRELYAKQGSPPVYRAGTYEHMFKSLKGAPGATFHAAHLDDKTVAVQINFTAFSRVFGWQFAVDPEYRGSYPQALLFWHDLLAARDAGVGEYDLASAPNQGIAVYKKKCGAIERPCTVLERATMLFRLASPVLSSLKRR